MFSLDVPADHRPPQYFSKRSIRSLLFQSVDDFGLFGPYLAVAANLNKDINVERHSPMTYLEEHKTYLPMDDAGLFPLLIPFISFSRSYYAFATQIFVT